MVPVDPKEAVEMQEESEETVNFTVRLPKSIRERLKAVSEKGKVTEALLVKRMLRKSLPEWETHWGVKK